MPARQLLVEDREPGPRPWVWVVAGVSTLGIVMAILTWESGWSPLPSNRTTVVHGDTDAWKKQLETGGEVEFRRVAADNIHEGIEAAADSAPEGPVVRTIGKLTPGQKRTALDRLNRFVVSSEQRYRQQPANEPDQQVASLKEAYVLVMYQAAVQMLHEDTVWAFERGGDDAKIAWRNVPRGWRKLRIGNVAETEDGGLIDIIVAVDPKQDPAVQSILEQLSAAQHQRVVALANDFNSLPLSERKKRIEDHLSASEARKSGEPFNSGSLLDSSLRINREGSLVFCRW